MRRSQVRCTLIFLINSLAYMDSITVSRTWAFLYFIVRPREGVLTVNIIAVFMLTATFFFFFRKYKHNKETVVAVLSIAWRPCPSTAGRQI